MINKQWDQEEFLKEFNEKFENGKLEEEIFEFLNNDYFPKIFGELDNEKKQT